MTFVSFEPRPGIFTDDAPGVDAPFRYTDGSLVRFYNGKAETIGGWQKKTQDTFTGKTRTLLSSAELDGTRNVFAGTHSHLQVLQGGVVNDITPFAAAAISLGTDPISTTDTDATVTVTATAHQLVVGQRVVLDGASGTVGGLTIDGEHSVATVVDANTFTYEATSAATSTTTGGGASMTARGVLVNGEADGTFEYGYGVGGYGQSTWNTARSSSTIELAPRVWSIQAYGEDALCAPGQQGSIYQWDATNGVSTRAVEVTNAPPCNFIIVNPQSRHLITFGADDDPMKIRWAAQGTLTTWAASSTNDAGDVRLLDGSEIRAASRTKAEIVVWTDTAAYSLRHVGGAFVFQLTKLAEAAPILGQQAFAASDTFVAWMADGQFQFYDGVVRSLPCPVAKHVFNDDLGPGLNLAQRQKIVGFCNAEFGEVGWLYPSAGSTEVDRVVVWSYKEGADVWWIGQLDRTAMIDRSIELNPIGVDSSGNIYNHEIPGAGNDGNPLAYSIETGGAYIDEGENLYAIRQAIPDFVLTDSDVSNALKLQFFSKIYPQGSETAGAINDVISTTTTVDTRITGRSLRFKASSNSAQLAWRVGKMRFDVELLDAAR